MSEKPPSSNSTSPSQFEWLKSIEAADRWVICVVVFLASVSLMLAWRLTKQPEGGDAAIWDYVAQGILRGQVPYRDVAEIKGPASAYLSALAMSLGKAFGLRDILAVRYMQIALGGALSSITFLVAETYLRQRFAGLIAALLPLTSVHFVSWTEGGTQPKLTMIVFGMLSLLLIAEDRPFWAGVCSMLSCLSWQPGLLFTGISVLIFSRYLTTWRDLRAVKTLAGAALPLVIVVIYFYSVGALGDLWIWTVAYNFQVYAPEGIRSPIDTVLHTWTVIQRVFRYDIVWFLGGFVALILFTILHVRLIFRTRRSLNSPGLFVDGIIFAPVIYIAFCLINLQSGPDLIPLYPFFALFAGWFVTEAASQLISEKQPTEPSEAKRLFGVLPAGAVIFLVVCVLFRAITNNQEEWTLQRQDQELRSITSLVGPNDKVFVHGSVEILLALNTSNLNPYIMWDHGKARYIADKKYGGSSEGMINDIKAGAPKIVAITRMKNIPEAAALDQWLRAQYQKLTVEGYEAWLRKD